MVHCNIGTVKLHTNISIDNFQITFKKIQQLAMQKGRKIYIFVNSNMYKSNIYMIHIQRSQITGICSGQEYWFKKTHATKSRGSINVFEFPMFI